MPLANFFPLMGGDAGVYQTVQKVLQVIHYALRDPAQTVRHRAEKLMSPTTERNDIQEIKAIFDFVKSRFRYVHDPVGLEYVKSPEVMDQEITDTGYFTGDCDDVTSYIGALTSSVGYDTNIAIIAPIDNGTMDFKHIFPQVFSRQKNAWITLDACGRNKPFGWTAPYKRIKTFSV